MFMEFVLFMSVCSFMAAMSSVYPVSQKTDTLLLAVCEIVDYHARSSADYFQDIFVANVTYITLQSTLP